MKSQVNSLGFFLEYYFIFEANLKTNRKMNHLIGLKEVNGIKPLDELFDHTLMRRTGSVEIRPVSENKFKEQNISFRCFIGYEMGKPKVKKVWFGIPVELDPRTNRYKYAQIQIRNQRFFQLENEIDAITFHIIKHHMWMEGSPNLKELRYQVYDPEIKAINEINNYNMGFEAGNIIRNMADDEIKEFGRLFALDPLNCSINVVKASLQKTAMSKPQVILDYYQNMEFTRAKQNFILAESMGLITKDVTRGYLLRGVQSIGNQMDDAVRFLMKDLGLFTLLVKEAREKEKKAIQVKDRISVDLSEIETPIVRSTNGTTGILKDLNEIDPVEFAAQQAAKNLRKEGSVKVNPNAVSTGSSGLDDDELDGF
jgi:hypothetical protein